MPLTTRSAKSRRPGTGRLSRRCAPRAMGRLRVRLAGEEGAAMIVATGALLVMMILVAAVQSGAISVRNSSSKDRNSKRALAAANAGLSVATDRVLRMKPAGVRCITSIGRANGVTRRVQSRLVWLPQFPFLGILGLSSVFVNDQTTVYGDVTGSTLGDIGTNGSATVGPSANASLIRNAYLAPGATATNI